MAKATADAKSLQLTVDEDTEVRASGSSTMSTERTLEAAATVQAADELVTGVGAARGGERRGPPSSWITRACTVTIVELKRVSLSQSCCTRRRTIEKTNTYIEVSSREAEDTMEVAASKTISCSSMQPNTAGDMERAKPMKRARRSEQQCSEDCRY